MVLASLGYVKLAEQKLPEVLVKKWSGMTDSQWDMLSVDSEGCAYRRVKVNG